MIFAFMRPAWRFFVSDSGLALVIRVIAIYGTLAGLISIVIAEMPQLLPSGGAGLALFVFFGVSLSLSVQLLLLHRDIARGALGKAGPPEADFADSLVRYAESLAGATPPRDDALLELRRWSSRVLHLIGRHAERVAIGKLALGAAAAAGDRYTQASILIDDLGWGLHKLERSAEARVNIEEALRILDGPTSVEMNTADFLELRVKASRHLVDIDFARNGDVQIGRARVDELVKMVSSLPDPKRGLHLAQLQHLEAALILRHVAAQVGPAGIIDPTGRLAVLHSAGVSLSTMAESTFAGLGDVERQVKAQKVLVGLLRHGGHHTRILAAESRLVRLQAVASRRLPD